MASTTLENPPENQLHLIPGAEKRTTGAARLKKLAPADAAIGTDFSVALIEANRMPSGSRAWRLATSTVLHVIALGAALLAGLWFTDTLDLRAYTMTLLAAPPPPPPPPPPAAAAAIRAAKLPRRVFSAGGKLLAPTTIPKQIANLREEPLPPEAGIEGVAGGVPGGVPGGQLGGVIGGVIGGIPSTAAMGLPPPPESTKKIVRVGGRIRKPRAIVQTEPKYPVLARQARVQGDVLLDAILDTDGRIAEVSVVSGHPLLIPAALECVKSWRFEPTYLNDEPVAVKMIITVSFRIG